MGVFERHRRREGQRGATGAFGRRDLLTAAGIATAAAVPPAEVLVDFDATGDEATDDPRRLSYRETDHIRWFYARARM